MKIPKILMLSAMVFPFGSAMAAFPQYRFTDLRPLMQSAGSFTGINNNGDIAGQVDYNDRVYLQLYRSGVYSLVAPPVQSPSIRVHFYNDSGIVGGTTGHYATFWNEQSGWTLLPRAGSTSGGIGDTHWVAAAYNESLQTIAGYAEVRTTSGQMIPFGCRWNQVNGEWVRIMSPTDNGRALYWSEDMNDNGDIVGTGKFGSNTWTPTIWSRETNLLTSLPYPSAGGWEATNFGFDSQNHIIGLVGKNNSSGLGGGVLWYANSSSSPQVFYYSTVLGYAKINKNGWLAAAAGVGSTDSAVLWSKENGFVQIRSLLEGNSPNVDIKFIFDLNDHGSMLVMAQPNNGGDSFMARIDPVPEPTSLLLLTPGLAWVVMRRRKRKASA